MFCFVYCFWRRWWNGTTHSRLPKWAAGATGRAASKTTTLPCCTGFDSILLLFFFTFNLSSTKWKTNSSLNIIFKYKELKVGDSFKCNLSAQRQRTGRMTVNDVWEYLHLPISEASKKLNVCNTVLKKICRRSGLSRWPYRKVCVFFFINCSTTLIFTVKWLDNLFWTT